MDSSFHGRPPTRRRVLGDGTNRANEGLRNQGCDAKQQVNGHTSITEPQQLPQNKAVMTPKGSPAVHHELVSPDNKRLSAIQAHEHRPHNTTRDSETSNASTNASSSNRRRKTHIGPWQLGRTIGRGGCSRVRLVRHSATGQYGAAKIISKATAEKVRAVSLANLVQSAAQDPTLYSNEKAIPVGLEREICIMKLLDHPNIVRLYDIWENRDEIYIIMEFVEGGELFSYIHEQGGLIEIHAVHIFRQIIAALIYCHRISIYHRDLKPENILLDRNTMTVKLVDFGMAALQPTGKKLTTPCGSPHYAAPEVIRTTSYDGAKADVWSCGVVLFVLLTGTPPFNYSGDDRHLKHLFRDIAEAKYVMPDNLSKEAQDLIRRILIPDPKHRISLTDIWDHPFLRKHQEELNFLGDNTQIDHWTGSQPVITDWTMLNQNTIDRDILRYLRTLWHSVTEENLVQKLISQEPNQEKFFYAALRKYHMDQLENYQPSLQYAVAPSNSDYHHNTRYTPTCLCIENLPSNSGKRSRSAYSILNNEHLHSKHSLYEPPASEASYDPYRASRQPMIPTPSNPLTPNVKVHRGHSGNSGHSDRLRPATALGHRTGSSLRVQALRNNSKRTSTASHGSSYRSSPSQRTNSVQRHSMSRSSLTSSHWASSPPVIVRSGGTYKRGVSFSHLRHRRSSAATASSWQTEIGSYADYVSYKPLNSIGSYDSAMRTGVVPSNTKSRALASTETPRLRLKKSESPTKYIHGEARKVSMELGKVMEEAFNRSSARSSIRPGTDVSQYDTPTTSFSDKRHSGGSTLVATPISKVLSQERPLPAIPVETPNTFVQRKLAETRAEIARRLREEGNAERFNDILEHLDRLMVPETSGNKRIVSAPARSPGHGPLHVIPEEGKTDNGDGAENLLPRYRVFTDPISPQDYRVAPKQQQTIRVVDASPTRIAPLNIRKRSGASLNSTRNVENTNIAPRPTSNVDCIIPQRPDLQNKLFVARADNDASALGKQNAVIRKKKSWFRRETDETKRDHDEKANQVKKKPSNGLLQIAETWHGTNDHIKDDLVPLVNTSDLKTVQEKSDKSSGSEFPMRNSNPGASKGGGTALKGFLALFGKKTKDERGKHPMKLGEMNFSTSSILSNFDLDPDSNNDRPRTNPPEMQMNWISRFLHIKPASATMCLRVGRGKVRQDFVRLLRDWQRFGVQDVSLDRQSNSISARVDKSNHLKIKPVSFVIELFVVLEHGRRANLCLARFTQTCGAASSFRKVFDIIEDICRARCMLVEDEEKKASMMEVLG